MSLFVPLLEPLTSKPFATILKDRLDGVRARFAKSPLDGELKLGALITAGENAIKAAKKKDLDATPFDGFLDEIKEKWGKRLGRK
jgi:hypothetical protein